MNAAAKDIPTILGEAIEITSTADRESYLEAACGGDAGLRRQIDQLLLDHAQAGEFLERPAVVAATIDIPALQESPGSVIGPYKLLEQIGEGGFGVVFMAEQSKPLQRKVALKIIKPGMDTREVIARFEAERQALALMDHPNIAKVLDAGTTHVARSLRERNAELPDDKASANDTRSVPATLDTGRPYFVMELVRGVPVTEYCDQKKLTIRERLELFITICQAVQHAHQKGIIHRDLKPTNVLVTQQDGRALAKVIDFGVAKATGQKLTDKTLFTGFAQLIGTPLYMSPEQAELSAQDVDTRSDIYSLGVLLYELLAGTTPFDKDRLKTATFDELRRIIREEEPPRPSARLSTLSQQAISTVSTHRGSEPRHLSRLLQGELDWIAMKSLEKDRNRRYETASALAIDVERYLKDEPVQAFPPSAWYRFRKFARRNKTRLAVTAGLLLAVTMVAASIGWAVWREVDSERAEKSRLASVEGKVHEDLNIARTLVTENKLAAARQALTAARAKLGDDRSSLKDVAAAVDTSAGELDRFQLFLGLIDQAQEAEAAPMVQNMPAWQNAYPNWSALPSDDINGLRPEAAVPFLLKALALYGVLERPDWSSTLEGGFLGRDQIEQIRRLVYQELYYLAAEVWSRREYWTRRQDYRQRGQLSFDPTAWTAIHYLDIAASAHPPTPALYGLRSLFHKETGNLPAFLGDLEREMKARPTMAIDLELQGMDAFTDRKLAPAVESFEAALRLEPTDYSSMMWLGYCWCDLGQRQEDYVTAVAIFTGCILKRPEHAHAFYCRGNAQFHLRRYQEALADYSRAVELEPAHWRAWRKRGDTYKALTQFDNAIADYSKAIELDPKNKDLWYGRGQAQLAVGRLDNASADFCKVIELDPKFSGGWSGRGQAYFKLGLLDKAIVDYDKALELDPKFSATWTNRGLVYEKLGLLDKAIVDYDKALELDPKASATWNNRGNVDDNLGQQDKALADYSRAIELDPTNAVAWCNRGHMYDRRHQEEKAVLECSKAIELDPKYALAWFDRGLAYLHLGQCDKALSDCSRAIELDPKDSMSWNNRGNVYDSLGQWDKAVANYSKAIELDPKNAIAWCNRGKVHSDHFGQHDKAIAYYSKAIELDPNYELAWDGRGLAYARLGQRDKALSDMSRALELVPKDAFVWNNRGMVYGALGEWEEAITDYSRAIELDPELRQPRYNRGAAYCDHLKEYDKAVADFSQILALHPEDVSAWYGRGNSLSKLGQWDKAVPDFTQAIQLDPKFVAAWNARGNGHYQLRHWGNAIADYSKAIELDPRCGLALNSLAWVLSTCPEPKLREPVKAVGLAQRAVELSPEDAECRNTLGVAYYRAGDWKEAIATLEKAAQLRQSANGEVSPNDSLFLAMARWQLGDKETARTTFEQVVQWMEKDQPKDEELDRIRAEATELLGVKDRKK